MNEQNNTMATRLGALRSLAKLSQADLGRSMGVSPSLISHWEAGTRTPSQVQLMNLCRHLGISLDYLLNETVRPVFSFRARATLKADQQAAVNRALIDASEQTYFIEAILRMANKPVQAFGLKADFSFPQVSSLANTFRETLKLNKRATLEELKHALAEWGINVFEWALPYQISGMSYRGALTVIFINRHHDATRRLFTLAHELAHVIFHLGRGTEGETSISEIASNRDPLEKEANRFASEFLIPERELRAVVQTFGDRLDDPSVMEAVARSFHVSRDAVFYRLADLGFCDWKDSRKYFTRHEEQPGSELRVTKIEEQVPGNLLETALALYFNERVSSAKLAEWFFTSRLHIDEYLFALGEDQDNTLAESANGHDGNTGS
ncbi:MAG TPA: XRE family transcriptional regulator [Candidatus Acidoferrum sp.]|nr:XRE family transcriptional regulator [Candidatus Acidoferrum sp.]